MALLKGTVSPPGNSSADTVTAEQNFQSIDCFQVEAQICFVSNYYRLQVISFETLRYLTHVSSVTPWRMPPPSYPLPPTSNLSDIENTHTACPAQYRRLPPHPSRRGHPHDLGVQASRSFTASTNRCMWLLDGPTSAGRAPNSAARAATMSTNWSPTNPTNRPVHTGLPLLTRGLAPSSSMTLAPSPHPGIWKQLARSHAYFGKLRGHQPHHRPLLANTLRSCVVDQPDSQPGVAYDCGTPPLRAICSSHVLTYF